MSDKRRKLLMALEGIIGSRCYNGSIQNYGPGGEYEGEGRTFRYPLTVIGEDGKPFKPDRHIPPLRRELTSREFKSGYYAFGANQLAIMQGLEEVLEYLEEKHGLKIEGDEFQKELPNDANEPNT